MPVGPGVNAGWFHESITLQIGGVGYAFQTFSLWDVYSIWPFLGPIYKTAPRLKEIHEAIAAGQQIDEPQRAALLEASANIVKILEIIQPALAADEERLREITGVHFTDLFKFYAAQDWERILVLVEQTTAEEAAARGADPKEAHAVFMAMCSAAAKQCNMSLLDFVRTRFEFAADQIVSLREAWEKASEAADEGKSYSWREATMKIAATFGVKPEFVPEDKQPPLIKALNRHRVN